MKFAELSEAAKDKAREPYRTPEHEWWDCVYEDAKAVGELLGFEVKDIQFSGFASQGDGASFTGKFKPIPTEGAKAYASEDETIHSIADELATACAAFRLMHGTCDLGFSVMRHGTHYVHSNTMVTGWDDHLHEDIPYEAVEAFDVVIECNARRLADWIYAQLEAEHDHLTSNESIDEVLADFDFDELGNRIPAELKTRPVPC